jgi:hypothetical protein
MKLYLAGRMSGLPQSNIPAFDAASARLRAASYDIVSPAELDDPEIRTAALADRPCAQTWGDFLSRDVKIVADAVDGIVFLDNWWESRGARLEAFVALLTNKRQFGLYLEDANPPIAWMSADLVRSIIRRNMP